MSDARETRELIAIVRADATIPQANKTRIINKLGGLATITSVLDHLAACGDSRSPLADVGSVVVDPNANDARDAVKKINT